MIGLTYKCECGNHEVVGLLKKKPGKPLCSCCGRAVENYKYFDVYGEE